MFQEPKESLGKRLASSPTVIALMLVCTLGGGLVGAALASPKTVTLEDGRVVGIGEVRQMAQDVDFQQFWDVWSMVQRDYVFGPVSDKELFYGALRGLVEGVGDPYTAYFTPQESTDFQSDLAGQFEGIGAEIGLKDGQVVVVAPLKDAPAERAGVLAGDEVYAIDDAETFGMSIDQAVKAIRGPRGTTVVLTVAQPDADEVRQVSIVRDIIEVASVRWDVRPDGVAVISVASFNEDTARAFSAAVVDVLAEQVKGIVLDMRNNPGGFLDRGVSVAGEWLGNQTVVIERMDGGLQQEIKAQGVARLKGIKTVVLINGGSASATEIVAGALQDYGVASIVGTQSFGKGSVQEYRPLPDGSALKITVAEWLTPQGRSIQKEGISPDHIVDYTAEDVAEGVDPQLEFALTLLQQP